MLLNGARVAAEDGRLIPAVDGRSVALNPEKFLLLAKDGGFAKPELTRWSSKNIYHCCEKKIISNFATYVDPRISTGVSEHYLEQGGGWLR